MSGGPVTETLDAPSRSPDSSKIKLARARAKIAARSRLLIIGQPAPPKKGSPLLPSLSLIMPFVQLFEDFHAVNCRGTEMMLVAARERGVSRFLHCSTEAILFNRSPPGSFNIKEGCNTPNQMPGPYTRAKLLAEQKTSQAAATGFPVVIASPTMPIGPHYGNLTPPALMLQYFLNRRVQLYFDFVMNLVDVRDVAAGLVLAMKRGQSGHRYILGGEAISLSKVLTRLRAISDRKALPVPVPAIIAQVAALAMEFMADRLTHRPPAATVEGVRIAMRSKSLSSEKSWRDLGYTPQPIERALREVVASMMGKVR